MTLKKKPSAPPSATPEPKAVRSNVVSARFEPTEMEHIENAAASLGIPLASFIRSAAVGRAVDVLNAKDSKQHLYPIALELVGHILHPTLTIGTDEVGPYGNQIEYSRVTAFKTEEGEADDRPYEGYVNELLPPTLAQARQALETCGTEFIGLLLECWKTKESGEYGYTPKVFLDSPRTPTAGVQSGTTVAPRPSGREK